MGGPTASDVVVLGLIINKLTRSVLHIHGMGVIDVWYSAGARSVVAEMRFRVTVVGPEHAWPIASALAIAGDAGGRRWVASGRTCKRSEELTRLAGTQRLPRGSRLRPVEGVKLVPLLEFLKG